MINYYVCIKYLFPSILDSDFSLVDHLDGKGIQISKWNFSEPKPSREKLEAAWPKADIAFRMEALRKVRDEKISSCDWTHLLDHPLKPEKQKEWKDYRHKLRNIMETIDPHNPVWPEEPKP